MFKPFYEIGPLHDGFVYCYEEISLAALS